MNDLFRLFLIVTDALARRGPLVFLSDFDGIRTRFVDHPEAAWLPREVRENLRSLARAPRVHLGVVSSRGLDDLRSRVRLPELVYGCHGLEIEGPGIVFAHPDAEARRGDLAAIAEEIGRRLEATPGVMVEAKGLCVAVHRRHVAAGSVPRVEDDAAALVGAWRGFVRMPGPHVVDIVPAVAWDRSRCVRHVREHVRGQGATEPVVVYLGDLSEVHCLIELLAEDLVTGSSGCA